MSISARAVVHVSGGGTYSRAALPYGSYGSYKPDRAAGTAGIPSGSPALTVQAGTGGVFVITTPGVYDLIDFQCEVQPRVAGVIFSRCKFRGNTTRSTNGALCNISSSAPYGATIATFYDCEFVPTLPSIWWDAVGFHDYKAYRCYARGTVDGFGAYGSGTSGASVGLYGNHVEKLSMFSPDPNHAGDAPVSKTHNDCVQWQGGNGLVAVGNNFVGFDDAAIGEASYSATSPNPSGGGPNNTSSGTGWNANYPNLQANGSVLQISGTNGGECSGLLWDKNWMSGANRHLTLSQAYASLGSITNNVSDRNHLASVAMNVPTGMDTGTAPSLTLANNTYSDDGTAVTVFHT